MIGDKGVSTLTNLTFLDLSKQGGVTNDGLTHLINLQTLSFWKNSFIGNLPPNSLPNIKYYTEMGILIFLKK
jgi:hypothetical protein